MRAPVRRPMPGAWEPWTPRARRALPAMRAWRTAFHQEPELSLHEERTREKVVRALEEMNIPHRTFAKGYGVVGLVGGDRTGTVVALRADMDGLPVTEATGLSFASRFPGRMHACGHDVHMASLLGAAAILQRPPRPLAGPVKLIFQPAEEEGRVGGALALIQQGCLEDPRVDFVVGQHVIPSLPLGQVGWKAGPMMAAADAFRITVRGKGGHAATPHQGPDAVVVASEIVLGMQALVEPGPRPDRARGHQRRLRPRRHAQQHPTGGGRPRRDRPHPECRDPEPLGERPAPPGSARSRRASARKCGSPTSRGIPRS